MVVWRKLKVCGHLCQERRSWSENVDYSEKKKKNRWREKQIGRQNRSKRVGKQRGKRLAKSGLMMSSRIQPFLMSGLNFSVTQANKSFLKLKIV